MANSITNVPSRATRDLTLLSYVPLDVSVLKDIKFPAGNFPLGFSGEALSLDQLGKILPTNPNTLGQIQIVANSVQAERTRAVKEETDLRNHINQNQNSVYSYKTKADFDAAKANIPSNSSVRIAQGENSGLNVWDGTNLVQAEGDNLGIANRNIATAKDGLLKDIYLLRLSFQNLVQAVSEDSLDLLTFKNTFETYKVQTQDLLDKVTKEFNRFKEVDYNNHFGLLNLITAVSELVAENKKSKEVDYRLKFSLEQIVYAITQIETYTAAAIKTPLKGTSNVYTFPEPKSIATIDIATTKNPLPNSGDEGTFIGEVTITIDGESCKVFSEIKVQGQSSAGFPKKNWSLDFYTDASLTEPVYIKIGNTRPNDNFVFKANFIDHLHIRHNFNLNLWYAIQNTRKGYPKWDIDNFYIGKTGADAVSTGATASPSMFPTTCNINGAFYGVGSITYTKKRSNYNMSKNKPKEILIDFGGITAIDDMNPTIIEIKCPSKPTQVTLDAIERWRGFARSSAADMAKNWANFADKQNLIDYYCFVDFFCGADVVFKNLMLYSWDAKIWRIGVYDVDMAYGLDFDGTTTRFTPTWDAFQGDGFWSRVRTAFKTEIEARYAYFRSSGLFSVDRTYIEMSKLLSYYPTELLNAEYAKWNPPSLSNTSFPIMMDWLKQRLVYLDNKHSYKGT